jgi:hypothetical protein
LKRFGAPLSDTIESDFTKESLVYQIGVPPNRIDIVMGVDGLEFKSAWQNRVAATYDGLPMYLPSLKDLITNKKSSGRPQDLLDLQRLLEAEQSNQ